MEYGASRFPMSSHFFLTANEKDFSLALEMTVWESGILASLPFSRGRALSVAMLEASHSAAYQK
ncbi:MAG: hypothetical protein PUI60_04020 [Dialister sp.]|nr:hypothetical protein [Dialister sp.]MCI7054674.1 hypothetical protein [Dialister sp.]MDD6958586.1 hypothetical protein [Dialister sp.]MDY6115659.1 hypothetical protein [Dialister sp.]HAQ45101.1 hypothetical protein [Dialister sp.]